jgi:hypothetical protein
MASGDLDAAEAQLRSAQGLYEELHEDVPPYAHQKFHFIAFLLHKERGNEPAMVSHLQEAHRALQRRLAELDSAGRQQLQESPDTKALLAAMDDLKA